MNQEKLNQARKRFITWHTKIASRSLLTVEEAIEMAERVVQEKGGTCYVLQVEYETNRQTPPVKTVQFNPPVDNR